MGEWDPREAAEGYWPLPQGPCWALGAGLSGRELACCAMWNPGWLGWEGFLLDGQEPVWRCGGRHDSGHPSQALDCAAAEKGRHEEDVAAALALADACAAEAVLQDRLDEHGYGGFPGDPRFPT